MPDFATSPYLIYSMFEGRNPGIQSTVCGSVLLDYAQTSEEAAEKCAVYRARNMIPKYTGCTYTYVYIANRDEWWNNFKVKHLPTS